MRLETPLICTLPFVFAATGQTPATGAPDVVIFTVIVQVVCRLVIVRLATVMVLLPAMAVTAPPAQVPPTVEGVATAKPAGSVSVKLYVCVVLPAG